MAIKNISSFTQKEIRALFLRALIIYKQPNLEIRIASRSISPASAHGRALIVTPKLIGNAPTRNLMRRRIKAIFYENNLFKLPYDFIFMCKKNIDQLDFAELKDIILKTIESYVSKNS